MPLLPALAALLLAAPATRPAPAGADVSPAMYTLSDDDTTVYLFGSMHVLPDGVDWRSDAFDAAFAEADAIYFEIPMTPANLTGMQAKVMQHAMLPPDQTLTDLLSEEEAADLATMAKAAAMPMEAVDRMKPSLASSALALGLLKDTGLEAENGVEMTLAAEAARRQVEVGGLETINEQIALLFAMPQELGLAMLRDMLDGADDPEAAREEVRGMYDAWSTGDLQKMHDIVDDLAETSPDLYARLITDRNKAWIADIEGILADRPGVVVLVVGAGHLEGPDGVVPLLNKAGVAVERVQ